MRIIQLLPTLSFGDAIGNDTIALKGALSDMGFDTGIYAENIDKRLPSDIAKGIDKLRGLKDEDIILYHKSTGTELTFRLDEFKGRKIMVYHNITPPEFFRPYSTAAQLLLNTATREWTSSKTKWSTVLRIHPTTKTSSCAWDINVR